MDIVKLLELYDKIPPRQPRGHPQNKWRIRYCSELRAEAKKQGLSYVEALKLCREKKESAGISPST